MVLLYLNRVVVSLILFIFLCGNRPKSNTALIDCADVATVSWLGLGGEYVLSGHVTADDERCCCGDSGGDTNGTDHSSSI